MIPTIDVTKPGQIVILNGAPRSGKSSIVTVIQDTFDGPWMNLGVDVFARQVTPTRYRPGMGLRPGEEGHALAPLVPVLYAALYDSIAAHSRAGLNVVVDVGHHDAKILADSAVGYLDCPFSSSAFAARSTSSWNGAPRVKPEEMASTRSARRPSPFRLRSSGGKPPRTFPASTTSRSTPRC